jgi:transposase
VGQTPILTEGGQSAHWSVMSAISPYGDIYYRLQESSYTGSAVAQFIRDLLGLTSQKLHIIWDGASIPRSQEVKDLLSTENQGGRVQLTLLPAYSPQLNAAEPVWAWLKGGELKNVCCKTLDELTQKVQPAFSKLTDQTEIIRHVFTHPEVAFY